MPADGMAGHYSPPCCYQYFGSPPVIRTINTYSKAMIRKNAIVLIASMIQSRIVQIAQCNDAIANFPPCFGSV